MDAINLKKIKEHLPHGAIMRISSKTGVHMTEVSKMMSGKKKPKPEVIEAAAEIAIEYNARKQKAQKAILRAIQEVTGESDPVQVNQ